LSFMRSLREYIPNLDICFHTNHRTTLLELVLKVSSEARILASTKDRSATILCLKTH